MLYAMKGFLIGLDHIKTVAHLSLPFYLETQLGRLVCYRRAK